MGRRQQPESERNELRKKILRAAGEIITREGFSSFSMRKLADKIGYSVGSIYLYFQSREEIARSLSYEGYSQLFNEMSAAKAKTKGKNAASQFAALMQAYIRFGMENPETYRLIFMDDPVYLKTIYARKQENDPANLAFKLLVDAISELQSSDHNFPKAHAIQIAETCHAAAHGIVSMKLTCPYFPTSSAEEMSSIMLKMLLPAKAEKKKA